MREQDGAQLRATIRAAQAGDEQAFETLLLQLQTPIYRLAYTMLHHSRADAEDATQEVLIKLWRTLPDYRFECPILPYVLRMTRTVVLDMIRRRAGEAQRTLPLSYESEDGEITEREIADTDESNDPVRAYAREERIAAVRAAIDSLDEIHREILLLREIHGLPYDRIAHILGVKEGTVKSRLARAKEILKNVLKSGNFY